MSESKQKHCAASFNFKERALEILLSCARETMRVSGGSIASSVRRALSRGFARDGGIGKGGRRRVVGVKTDVTIGFVSRAGLANSADSFRSRAKRFEASRGRPLRQCRRKRSSFNSKVEPSDMRQAKHLIVIGTGIAGTATALKAASLGARVTMLSAGKDPRDCNSYWAQGGIIYRNYDPEAGDSREKLESDIRHAGAGLCDDHAVSKVASEGPGRVREILMDATGTFSNVPFDRDRDGNLRYCLEASHSAARILHWGDWTGKVITDCTTASVDENDNIEVLTGAVVLDLVMSRDDVCVGVDVLLGGEKRRLEGACGVVLASGGLCGVYQHSTNPVGFNALGSSVALAKRVRAKSRDLEYVQFHPTTLHVPGEARFLLTEALRGEGAILRDVNGRAFAKDFHERGELAPRDVVARAVYSTMKEVGGA